MPPGLVIPTTYIAIDRFSAPLRAMRGALGSFVMRAQTGLAFVERGFRRVLSPLTAMQNSLRGLGVYIGLFTFIMILRSAIGVMAQFEQAQVDILAVLGKTDQTVKQTKALSDQARVLSLRYGEAAKSVLALDLSLIKLGFRQSDVMQMTKPIMTGTVALKAEPEELAKTVGAVLQAFKMPASETKNVVDLMAKAADLSALDWSNIQTMLPRAMQSAALAGMSFKQLLTLFAMARNAQVHVASGSTAIKNMLIKGAIWNKDFNVMLQTLVESPNAIKKAYKMFGAKSLVTALPLAEAKKLGNIEDFEKKLESSFAGYAEQVAMTRLNSTIGRLTLFKRAYEELIISIDDGNGPIGAAIKRYLDVGRAMLLLTAGSEPAKTALGEMDKGIIATANSYLGWLKALGMIIITLLTLKAILIVWNALLVASRVVLFAWNITLGVTRALMWGNALALRGNIVALTAYRVAVTIARYAALLFNAVLTMSPLGLAIIGLGLLAFSLSRSSKAYNDVGASARNAGLEIKKANSMATTGLDVSNVSQNAKNKPSVGNMFWSSITDDLPFLKNIFSGISMPQDTVGMMNPFMDRQMSGLDSLLSGINKKDSLNFGAIKQEDLVKQLQLVQSGNVNIDINNRSGFPAKASSQGASIRLRQESTFDNGME